MGRGGGGGFGAGRADLAADHDRAEADDEHDDADRVEEALAALEPAEEARELDVAGRLVGGAAIAAAAALALAAALPAPLVAHAPLAFPARRLTAAARPSGRLLLK